MKKDNGPVMELIRASMLPSFLRSKARSEDPVCQVVSRAARADIAENSGDHVHSLAIGAGVSAAGLISWLAQSRGTEPSAVLDRIEQASIKGLETPNRVVAMLRTLLTGPPGMAATADLMVQIFAEDEEGYYDLIVELGEFSASCVNLLDTTGVSTTEATLKDLDEMLHDFYSG
ncbi:hypothetical protein [Streptomyces albus]|uniref:hypothetical protein n=1 Tax=Streptomyces albus TaxID=1888 RepID=UPI003456A062